MISKSKKEIAAELGVSRETLRKWIKRANLFPDKPPQDRIFTPAEVEKIRNQFVIVT